MNESFSKIDSAKRDRILNSAMEEFAKAGFDRASTNIIVENAAISKGLIFHYFGNKRKLYQYLIDFSYKYVTHLLDEGIHWEEKDFFKRAEEITVLKLSALRRYPRIYDFLRKTMETLSMEEMKRRFPPGLVDITRRVYTENIDYSLFRKDIDLGRTMEIVQWAVEGATAKVWNCAAGEVKLEDAIREHKKYMRALRALVYQ